MFSTGIMVKLFSESIESINAQSMESIYISGGNTFHKIIFAVLPQALPLIVAQVLYCLEINVHSATVLGLVGAEGIGYAVVGGIGVKIEIGRQAIVAGLQVMVVEYHRDAGEGPQAFAADGRGQIHAVEINRNSADAADAVQA